MSRNIGMSSSYKKVKRDNPWHYKDNGIFFSTIGLSIIGCIMIVSATMGVAAGSYSLLISTISKQIIFLVFGWLALYLANRFFTFKILTTSSFLSVLTFATYIALCLPLGFSGIFGAKAWIQLGPVSIQPSEFAKTSVILLIAAFLGNKDNIPFVKYKQGFNYVLVNVLLWVGIVVLFQSDFGSGMVMFCIAYICLLIPNSKRLSKMQRFMKTMVTVFGLLAIVILILPIGEQIVDAFFIFLKDYQKARIFSARDPFVDQYNTGFQLINGLVAFASGQWGGVGFGNSVRKFTNFPAANTDYILSIIVEELGFIGGFCTIFFLYGTIIFRLFKYAKLIKNESAKIILVGVAAYIFIHILFNVGGVTGLIPLTGVPLLMLSSGGSSTAATLIAIGVAQSVISQYKMGEIK